ncbi:MAG: cobyrinate a,c-diamide synthase, partial [Acidimicrobiales bacterium]
GARITAVPLLPPRVVIAGTHSGVGKTTVATGLMAALAGRGARVGAAKVGPDFIDPGYHALACGRPSRNLDVRLCGEEVVRAVAGRAGQGCDVLVVEGVMGLFDGAGAGPEASTAHVARLLDAPVVLVVDAAAMSGSVAALVHGFRTFDPTVRLAGVVLNRVGSDGHEGLLRQALAASGVDVLGVLRGDDRVVWRDRHLGLVPVAERPAEVRAGLGALAAVVAAGVDLDGLVALARTAPPASVGDVPLPGRWDEAAAGLGGIRPSQAAARAVPVRATGVGGVQAFMATADAEPGRETGLGAQPSGTAGPDPGPRPSDPSHRGRHPVVALAGGPAFSFTYPELPEALVAAGAEVVAFDPRTDPALPPGTTALIAGGGFPEVFAVELAANLPLLADLRRRVAGGLPTWVECGGLLWLARSLDGVALAGVVPADGRMTDRLTLGYRTATTQVPSPLGPAGTTLRGHEFRYSRLDPPGDAVHLEGRFGSGRAGYATPTLLATYLHVHPAGEPGAITAFVRAAAAAVA